jgi:hypothetical protein
MVYNATSQMNFNKYYKKIWEITPFCILFIKGLFF